MFLATSSGPAGTTWLPLRVSQTGLLPRSPCSSQSGLSGEEIAAALQVLEPQRLFLGGCGTEAKRERKRG